jgi:hypothetical protein
MTLPRTGVIRYNLADRGRKHRGPERYFDTAVAARLINSGVVQEKVKHGDMLGYFGHWPRVQFGLNPAEGGIVNGKAVSVEPALRTVSLVAYPDGWVEHEAEFLDNANGKIAARLFASKAGGFSSAIRAPQVGGKAIATEFHGFDFVLEPNYTSNRGYGVALDGVASEDDILDAVAERQQIMELCAEMLDSVQAEYNQMAEAMMRVTEENTYLISQLARSGKPEAVLDGVLDVVTRTVDSPLLRANDFLSATLVGFQKPKVQEQPRSPGHERQMSKFGV